MKFDRQLFAQMDLEERKEYVKRFEGIASHRSPEAQSASSRAALERRIKAAKAARRYNHASSDD